MNIYRIATALMLAVSAVNAKPTLKIEGSPVVGAIVSIWNQAYTGATITLTLDSSGAGSTALCGKKVDISLESAVYNCTGIPTTSKKIALDGVVLVTSGAGAGATCAKSLTKANLKSFTAGTLCPKVTIVGANVTTSGTVKFLVSNSGPINTKVYKTVASDSAVATSLDANSIGITTFAVLQKNPSLTAAILGNGPTTANIQSGKYILSRGLFVRWITGAANYADIKAFINFGLKNYGAVTTAKEVPIVPTPSPLP